MYKLPAVLKTDRGLLNHLLFLLLFVMTCLPSKAQIDSTLLNAIKNCDLTAIRRCASKVADINAADRNGANALMWAVLYCDLPVVKELVHHGAIACDSGFIYFKTYAYGSLQSVASCNGKLEVLQYLSDSLHLPLDEKELDTYTRKKDGWTPLSCAANFGHLDVVKYLLKKGVHIHSVYRNESFMALLKALKKRQWVIFRLMVEAGALNKLGEHAAGFLDTATVLEKQDSAKQDKRQQIALVQFTAQLVKAYFEENDPDYATVLNELGTSYKGLDQYEKALPLYQQALAISKKVQGEEHLYYATSLNTLATLYKDMGQYEKALPLCQQALAIYKKVLGEEHLTYATSLNDLSVLYTRMGQYEKALPLYQQVMATGKKMLGEENPNYAAILNGLATLYTRMGQYEKALPLYQQVLAIYKKALGEENRSYASILQTLANLYRYIGQYEKALLLYQQALSIYKKVLGEEHSNYINNLSDLSALYMKKGQYEKALPLYQQALAINKKILGEEHPNYASSLNDLSVLYWKMGQYEKALPLCQQVQAISKKVLGEEHPDYATSLYNLATLYRDMGQYTKALPLYQQSLAINKKVLGEEHPSYVSGLTAMGILYAMQDDDTKATAAFTHGNRIRLGLLDHMYASLSEKEKIDFLNKESYQFCLLPSLLSLQKITNHSVTEQLYANELALKGMVLQDLQHVLRSIHESNDSNVVATYEQWQLNKSLIGKQFLLPLKRRLTYLDSLQEATNNLEQKLSRQATGFRDVLNTQAVSPHAISHKLLKGQVAIEFMRFQLYNKRWTDTTLYAALVLQPGDSACRFVYLCEERQLKRLVERPAAIRTSGPLNDSLYKLIWKPLEKYLVGYNTVYYAPAGLLHRIAFHSLHVGHTARLLIDKYKLNQLLSTRSVALDAPKHAKPASVALWGNIDYGLQTTSLLVSRGNQQDEDDASDFNFYNSDTRALRGKSWPLLPGTKKEMNSISRNLKQAGITVVADSGAVATEEAFKALDGKSPQVLHLATHGFFLPITENKSNGSDAAFGREAFSTQQNPLFRSGLILAGGNHTWKGEPIAPGREDGILTAYEIAQMDLSNTDLVVLSACETALGDLQGNEGVFGLQRAFKLAGVKQMIMSLWKVPDAETTELMTQFYRNWLGGQSTREALRNAQLKMKKKYPPEKWAAFVLVE